MTGALSSDCDRPTVSETRKSLARPKENLWRWLTIVVMLTAAVMGSLTREAGAADTTDPSAAVIGRARTTLGPGLGQVKSLHLAGMVSAGNVTGTTEVWIDLVDGRFTAITDAGPLTASYGYDGRTGWHSDSKGFVLPQNGPMAKAIVATEIFDNTYTLYRPGHGGATVAYLGTRPDGGSLRGDLGNAPRRVRAGVVV